MEVGRLSTRTESRSSTAIRGEADRRAARIDVVDTDSDHGGDLAATQSVVQPDRVVFPYRRSGRFCCSQPYPTILNRGILPVVLRRPAGPTHRVDTAAGRRPSPPRRRPQRPVEEGGRSRGSRRRYREGDSGVDRPANFGPTRGLSLGVQDDQRSVAGSSRPARVRGWSNRSGPSGGDVELPSSPIGGDVREGASTSSRSVPGAIDVTADLPDSVHIASTATTTASTVVQTARGTVRRPRPLGDISPRVERGRPRRAARRRPP